MHLEGDNCFYLLSLTDLTFYFLQPPSDFSEFAYYYPLAQKLGVGDKKAIWFLAQNS